MFKRDLCGACAIGTAPIAQKYCCIYKDQTIGDDGFSGGWIVISKGQKHGLKVTDTVLKGNKIKTFYSLILNENMTRFLFLNGCQKRLETLSEASRW